MIDGGDSEDKKTEDNMPDGVSSVSKVPESITMKKTFKPAEYYSAGRRSTRSEILVC